MLMNITFLIRDINHPGEDQNLDFLVSKIEFWHFLSSAFRSFRPFGAQWSHILNFWSKLYFCNLNQMILPIKIKESPESTSDIEIFCGTNNRDSIMSLVKSLFLITSRTPYSKLFKPSFVILQVFNLIIVLCVTAFSKISKLFLDIN